jgi:hypothetical protein
MKTFLILFVTIGVLSTLLSSCSKELETPSFDISIDPQAIIGMEGDVYVCKKDYVKFLFSGNSDMISLYTGEKGSEYINRNNDLLKIEGTPYLQFSSTALNGTAITVAGQTHSEEYDSLRVYISDSFKGMTGNKEIDAANILEEGVWEDITSSFNMPKRRTSVASDIFSGKYDLTAYKGKELHVAFRFACRPSKTTNNTDYRLTAFRILSQAGERNDILVTTLSAGWTPYNFIMDDPYALDLNVDAPVPEGYHRTWVLNGIKSQDRLRIRGSAGQTDSDDWIKGLDDGIMSSYIYSYDEAGYYTLTFVASNSRFDEVKYVTKEITIKVVD